MNNLPPLIITTPALPKSKFQVPWKWLVVNVVIYFLCLVLPAIYLDNEDVWLGAHVLLIGWLGVLKGQFGWFANPLWLISMICLLLRLRITTIVVAFLAVLVGFTSLSLIGTEIPKNEAGVGGSLIVSSFGPAWNVWLSALATPGISAIWLKKST